MFGLTPGYDVKLLESNGRGYDCFIKTIEASDRDMVIAITGSTVLVDGGTGFANADVHAAIRSDLIKDTAESLAYTLNTQGIPPWVVARWGEDALETSALVEWDVTPPSDRTSEANAWTQAATAITAVRQALDGSGRDIDIRSVAVRFGIPIQGDVDGDGEPDEAGARPALREVA